MAKDKDVMNELADLKRAIFSIQNDIREIRDFIDLADEVDKSRKTAHKGKVIRSDDELDNYLGAL